jgi:hypothetical protein
MICLQVRDKVESGMTGEWEDVEKIELFIEFA